MKVEELRINNFIELADKGVYQIYDAHDLVNIDSWGDLKYCRSIPLTEEWLLKFGFEKYYNEFWRGDIGVSFNEDGHWDFRPNYKYDYYIQLKYVHQLQNLYFALTGSELVLSNVPEATKPAL